MSLAKEKLLAYLKKSQGDWISGEALSKEMAISRSAVWKHVRKLREEGYLIQSSPKKGYLFRKTSPRLLPGEIREGLDTKRFGKGPIFYFQEIDSTNTKAREFAVKGVPEGTLIIAEKQTKGRGRMGRYWFSPSYQGIYLSLVLRPSIPPSEAPKLTLLTGVVVAETLVRLTGLKVNMKWPNDILVGGKKMAGILTEMSAEMDAIDHIVVGLGVNVNTRRFPNLLKEQATSVFIETGKAFPRMRLLREYLRQYEEYYKTFIKKGFGPILKRVRDLTDLIGQEIMVEMIGSKYVGRVLDIAEDGALVLKDNKGRRHRIISGEITRF